MSMQSRPISCRHSIIPSRFFWACGVRAQPPQKFAKQSISSYRQNSNRSEEHTSELQSLMRISYADFCLKKKKTKIKQRKKKKIKKKKHKESTQKHEYKTNTYKTNTKITQKMKYKSDTDSK